MRAHEPVRAHATRSQISLADSGKDPSEQAHPRHPRTPAHASPALRLVVLRRVSAQMSASLSGTVNHGEDHALLLAQMDLQKATRRCELLQVEVNALH